MAFALETALCATECYHADPQDQVFSSKSNVFFVVEDQPSTYSMDFESSDAATF